MRYNPINLLISVIIMYQCSNSTDEKLDKTQLVQEKNKINICDSLLITDSFNFIDSVIYINKKEIPMYPYKEKYDSLESIGRKQLKDEIDKNPNAIIDVFPPTPELYAVDSLNNKISIKNYLNSIRNTDYGEYHCLLTFKVEWNGQISEIRLKAQKVRLPKKLNLTNVVKNIRANPAMTNYGIPFPSPLIVTLSLKNTEKD